MLQSVDVDGRQGFDIDLAKEVVENIKIPVVVSSGAGKLEDIKALIECAQPSGVAIASLLHYDSYQIVDIKNYLRKNNIGFNMSNVIGIVNYGIAGNIHSIEKALKKAGARL